MVEDKGRVIGGHVSTGQVRRTVAWDRRDNRRLGGNAEVCDVSLSAREG